MTAPSATALGIPGVYVTPEPLVRTLTGVRMDVAGFVGVAPRGPANVPVVGAGWPDSGAIVEPDRPRARSVPVAVESWDDYVRRFGAHEGPGRLSRAVECFFQQGGRRAYVVRIIAGRDDALAGVAATNLKGVEGDIVLRARDEGTWGNGLRATLTYRAQPMLAEAIGPAELKLGAQASAVGAGALLRLSLGGGVQVLRFVDRIDRRPHATEVGDDLIAVLSAPVNGTIEQLEVVEGTLDITDSDGRTERHAELGLDAAHPRWLGTVLCQASGLLWPDADWRLGRLMPEDPDLHAAGTGAFVGGRDRYDEITFDDLFDANWVLGDEADLPTTSGVHALLGLEDLAMVVVPDLYEPAAFEDADDTPAAPPTAGPTFELCLEPSTTPKLSGPEQRLPGLVLDPLTQRDAIVALQRKLVDLAETQRTWVVLLDVPPGLTQRDILRWRAEWNSMWAAAYHPWLVGSELPAGGQGVVRVVPSAAAAGIVARTEWAHGVPHGPSNELIAGVVDVEDRLTTARAGELHLAGINLLQTERDGVRLLAGRTLSREIAWRQLSVRRVITMIERAIAQQLAWAVFEPAGPALAAMVRQLLTNLLTSLFRAGAFAGATPAEAFFVHAHEDPREWDLGRFVVDVGVAPAAPLEYLVVRVSRSGDGTFTAEAVAA